MEKINLSTLEGDEVPVGKMKHVKVQGKEIVISNIGGKFYAMDDRCGHMNAGLSMGTIPNDGIVTCPFHGARFDATTGKKVKEPVLTSSQQMEPLPKTWQNYMEQAGQLMSHIKTYTSGGLSDPSRRGQDKNQEERQCHKLKPIR